VGIAEKVFKVRGQRSRSYVYKYVNAITAEVFISMVWRRRSLVQITISIVVFQEIPVEYINIYSETCDAFCNVPDILSVLTRVKFVISASQWYTEMHERAFDIFVLECADVMQW